MVFAVCVPAISRVARLLAERRSNQGTAADLRISAHTARHHTPRVLQKLGVRSRSEVGKRRHSLEADH